ncbi:PAAR motif of membran proteins [Vibrio phage vB_VpaM_sm033]|nr:PAAR motif of membran proteins [Vibrio phage vB_VpaM_sm033]
MGKPAAMGTQPTTGHGCYPPTTVTGTASTVKINGQSAMTQGDPMAAHCKVCGKSRPCHASSVSAGSGSVTIEGKPAARIGDSIGCGCAVAGASSNVFIGG